MRNILKIKNHIIFSITNYYMPLFFLTIIVCVIVIPQVYSQKIFKNNEIEILLPVGWEPLSVLPEGFNVGFQKSDMSFLLYVSIVAPEVSKVPVDTSQYLNNLNLSLNTTYSEVIILPSKEPNVNGRLILNTTYNLTDSDKRIRRRYTWFINDRTSFFIQCDATSGEWDEASSDFDQLIASLVPNKTTKISTVSDTEAIAKLRENIPSILSSFPQKWACELVDVNILLENNKRTLDINVQFKRQNLDVIYKATKFIFDAIKEGRSRTISQDIPTNLRKSLSDCSPFIYHVGQIWGFAWNDVADNESVIQQFKVSFVTLGDEKLGAITISRDDGETILTSKVEDLSPGRIASMYHIE